MKKPLTDNEQCILERLHSAGLDKCGRVFQLDWLDGHDKEAIRSLYERGYLRTGMFDNDPLVSQQVPPELNKIRLNWVTGAGREEIKQLKRGG